jgi:hypothetical protein
MHAAQLRPRAIPGTRLDENVFRLNQNIEP